MSKKNKSPKPPAKEVPLEQIIHFLRQKGYSVKKIWQPWRHVVAILTKDTQHFFFKMAAEADITPLTKNEVLWDTLVQKYLSSDASLVLPQIIESRSFSIVLQKNFDTIGSAIYCSMM